MAKKYGFTLIEAMIVIAFTAIIATLALPSMRALVNTNRVSTAADQLTAALNLARSEAIRQSRAIVVSGFNSSTLGDTDWNGGWHIWIDLNKNNTYDSGIDTEVYSYSMQPVQINTDPRTKQIVYGPTGYIVNSPSNSVSFIVCSNATGKTIQVSTSGFIFLFDRTCNA